MSDKVMVKTIKLKVKPGSSNWLGQAAIEVNNIWNYCNETAIKALETGPERPKPKWLSGYDLCYLTAGMTEFTTKIGADSIQCLCVEYAQKRKQAKKRKLRWRASKGSDRALGWVPFKTKNIKRHGNAVRFCGKTFRLFNAGRLDEGKLKSGCFAQDGVGDWYLCVACEVPIVESIAPKEAVGIDLGLKSVASTSDGDKLDMHFYRDSEQKLGELQRRGHKKQAKRVHRKIKRQRAHKAHCFTKGIVDNYQNIFVGDVSSSKLVKTRLSKSVLDSSWAMLKNQLLYKSQQAGRRFEVINESYTSRSCSECGSLSGPQGLRELPVREWRCADCGTVHDRDVNAARNILHLGLKCQPPSAGTSRLLKAA